MSCLAGFCENRIFSPVGEVSFERVSIPKHLVGLKRVGNRFRKERVAVTTTLQKPLMAHHLADYAFNLSFDKLPEAAIQEAKRRIIDSLGCAMGALSCGSEPAAIAIKVAQLTSMPNGSTVLTTQHKTTPDLASFATGVMFRYLDFNDTYLSKEPAHPSDNIAPILAVAESEKKSGKDILTAIVLAYEIQCRLCDAASIRARGWDHVTYGSFSAGLAAAKLMGLTKEQMVHVQGLAATPNNAMRQTRVGELSNWKGCAFANASRNAVFAALLAKNGMTGPSEIFEGEMGFWKQVSGPFELAPFGGESGQKDFMINQTYVKHFPAEYHSQSAIEAALELREQIGAADIDQKIESITIESFDAAVDIIAGFIEHWAPESRETADHSMPYCVSAALIDGDITLDTFTQARIHEPKLRALIQKVKVNRNAEMTAGYPDGIPNLLTIRTTDGKEYSKKVTYPLGHNKNPMNDADIEKKFRSMAERVMSKAHADQILAELWKIDTCSDVSKIFALFADALGAGTR
jgi:2-methylcitrate dehydratase